MKCIKCHNTLHTETGGFSMTINGKTIKVINAPVLHCKNCNSVIISDKVKEKAKEFIVNPYDDEKLPEKHRKNIPLLGDCMITENHVISVQNDVGTSYKAYIDVQNELVAAYNELRDELGKAKFGKTYAQCDEDEQKAIREYYPQKISEAEPKKYGGK